jgi:hypothetical protein
MFGSMGPSMNTSSLLPISHGGSVLLRRKLDLDDERGKNVELIQRTTYYSAQALNIIVLKSAGHQNMQRTVINDQKYFLLAS